MSDGDPRYELSRKQKSFIDLSLSFVPSPVTDDLTLLTNVRAINNAVKNVVMFLPGEVPFNRDIGSTTQRFLFDIIDDASAGLLADEIRRAILFCEPRVTFDPPDPREITSDDYLNTRETTAGSLFFQDDLGVFVDADLDGNSYEVTVKYRIIGTNQIIRVQEILTPTR